MLLEGIIFIFLIFLILCILKIYLFVIKKNNNNDDTKNVCDSIYNKNNNKKIKIIKNVFTYTFCDNIIKYSEKYASIHKWKTDRHEYYPTVDNQITPDWIMYDIILKEIKNNIFVNISKLYDVDVNKLDIIEIFIVKYSIGGQTKLEYHKDGSEFSFVISLNNEFSGGGTFFKDNQQLIALNIGDCVIFSGQNIHKAMQINSGTRYILTGFIKYGDSEECDQYIL